MASNSPKGRMLLLLLLIPSSAVALFSGTAKEDLSILEITVAPGKSILLPGLANEPSAGVIQWESTDLHKKQKPQSILDYYIQSSEPEIYSAYVGRVILHKNASIILLNTQKGDVGIYRLLVNMTEYRCVRLEVIDPLSSPFILRNSTSADAVIMLSCRAKEKASSYTWEKDGGDLPACAMLRHYNQTILINGSHKYACGRYKCTVKNKLSQNSTEYYLHPHAPHWYEAWLAKLALLLSLLSLVLDFCYRKGCILCCSFLWVPEICGTLSVLLALTATAFWASTGESTAFTVISLLTLGLILLGKTCSLAQCCKLGKIDQKNESINYKKGQIVWVIWSGVSTFGISIELLIVFHTYLDVCSISRSMTLVLTSLVTVLLTGTLVALFVLWCCKCWRKTHFGESKDKDNEAGKMLNVISVGQSAEHGFNPLQSTVTHTNTQTPAYDNTQALTYSNTHTQADSQ